MATIPAGGTPGATIRPKPPGSALMTITALAGPDAEIETQGHAVIGDK